MRSIHSMLLVCVMLIVSCASFAQVFISVNSPPPALPVYEQPLCPAEGYLWQPGYWAWNPDYGYFWVPGTWVLAADQGLLWTPGYWAFDDGLYYWHPGYWAPSVGFYGGIGYGYGYPGDGYYGGYWRENR
ncbi:MAG: YXWGXW repeat-containing protein, partial [Acidobacteria bacterium]|nr:YXWGXW repeat-containing protein [Acidobacteriota bacterium]